MHPHRHTAVFACEKYRQSEAIYFDRKKYKNVGRQGYARAHMGIAYSTPQIPLLDLRGATSRQGRRGKGK